MMIYRYAKIYEISRRQISIELAVGHLDEKYYFGAGRRNIISNRLKSSVAMATYNGERYITKQLESILKQTRPIDEVIISDDGSTDNTIDLIVKFINDNNLCNWFLYNNTEKHGVKSNFKNAIQKCSNEIIFLCDRDDI